MIDVILVSRRAFSCEKHIIHHFSCDRSDFYLFSPAPWSMCARLTFANTPCVHIASAMACRGRGPRSASFPFHQATPSSRELRPDGKSESRRGEMSDRSVSSENSPSWDRKPASAWRCDIRKGAAWAVWSKYWQLPRSELPRLMD